MKIVICGSISESEKMMEIKSDLEKQGHNIVVPVNTEEYAIRSKSDNNPKESTANKIRGDLIRGYYKEISYCDAVLIINMEKNGVKNYIGGNSFLELGFAHVLGKKTYLLNPIPKMNYEDELVAMQPTIIDGDLSKIT